MEQPGEKVTVGTADGFGSEKIFRNKHSYYFMHYLLSLCKEWLHLLIVQFQVPRNKRVFSLVIWKFAAPHLKFILSRDLWSLTKWSFLDTCGKSFFSISHFLWTHPCCKLKQQHVGTSTFQHCQIFLYHLLVETEQIKDFETFTFRFTLVLHLFTSLSSNAGYRIHPYLVGRIIRHDAQPLKTKIIISFITAPVK